jgi:Protein of unknown function (DUF732)
MFTHAVKRTATGLTIAGALAVVAGTATAHAIDSRDLFLRDLRQHGVAYNDPNATSDLGVGVCKGFDGGRTYPQVQSEIAGQPAASGFSDNDVVVVIYAAIDTMCPQFADRLPS